MPLKLILFCFGAVVGSFLNVCIHRLPRDESVVSPASRCPHCRFPVPWYLNVPLVSYVILRGRCHSCGERISPVYPVVELITGLSCVLIFTRFGLTGQAFVWFAFVCALVVITFVDLSHQIIPDVISLPGIPIGFVFSLFRADLSAVDSLLGLFLGAGLLLSVSWGYFLITRREGMGLGDVKLLAMIGAFLGWQGVLFVILAASVIGAATGTAIMLVLRSNLRLAIPFGPFLSMGG
jgi:leader peptidase (prepilin peptidase)/N-methyltransferase